MEAILTKYNTRESVFADGSRKRLVVECNRKIAQPQFGPESYTIEHKQYVFIFGRKKSYSNYKKAMDSAFLFMDEIKDKFSSVSYILYRESVCSGYVKYIKETDEKFFDSLDGTDFFTYGGGQESVDQVLQFIGE